MSGSAKVAFGVNETNASVSGEIGKLLRCIFGESNGLCVLNYLTNIYILLLLYILLDIKELIMK